jgi:hypothetical protein
MACRCSGSSVGRFIIMPTQLNTLDPKDQILEATTLPLHSPTPSRPRTMMPLQYYFAPLYFATKHLLVCDGLPLLRVLSGQYIMLQPLPDTFDPRRQSPVNATPVPAVPLQGVSQLQRSCTIVQLQREGKGGLQFAPLYFAPIHLLVCDGLPLLRVFSWEIHYNAHPTEDTVGRQPRTAAAAACCCCWSRSCRAHCAAAGSSPALLYGGRGRDLR